MPVLIFVMTMLMIFAILAYGRLETFRNLAGMQGEFKHYVVSRERKFINEQADKRYRNMVVNEIDEAYVRDKQVLASSTLSLYLFINKNAREKSAAELDQFILVAKNLITFLYGDADFFKEASSKRHDLLDELLFGLMKSSESLKISENKDLANIKFGDEFLDTVFYHMLKGSPVVDYDKKTFKPIDGSYPTLLDFIIVKKKLNIRIYLASPQLLMAIFGNPSVVENILKERQSIYKELNSNPDAKVALAERFKTAFIEKRLPGINDTMLNFEISKTNPADYK